MAIAFYFGCLFSFFRNKQLAILYASPLKIKAIRLINQLIGFKKSRNQHHLSPMPKIRLR
jgi:hypothetical protein